MVELYEFSLNDKDEIRFSSEALALARFLKDNQSFSVNAKLVFILK